MYNDGGVGKGYFSLLRKLCYPYRLFPIRSYRIQWRRVTVTSSDRTQMAKVICENTVPACSLYKHF